MESTSGRRGGAAGGAGGAAPEPGAPRSASLPRRPRRGGARRLPDPLPRRGGVRRLPDLSSIVGRDSAVICSKYSVNVESSSRFDRRALNCLINYYLDIDTFPLEETPTGCRKELFTRRELDSVADVTSCPSSKMGKVHADVLQDILANGILADDELFDEKSAVLLLAFLSSHLTNDKKLDQLKSLINTRLDYQSPVTKMSTRRRSRGKNDIKYQSPQTDKKDGSRTNQERAATIIQTQARSVIAKNKYCMREKAIFILQGVMRAWSAVTMKSNHSNLTIAASTPWQAKGNYNRYFIFIMERHRFVQMRKSAIIIQQTVRIWIRRRNRHKNNEPFERPTTPFKTDCIAPPPQKQCSGEDKIIASATPWQHCERVDTPRASANPHLLCFDGIYCLNSATPLQLSDK